MGINLFRRKSTGKMSPVTDKMSVTSTPVPRYYLVNIAPLLAELATQRIREQRARNAARYGIYYGKPLEELLRQNILQGEREDEVII